MGWRAWSNGRQVEPWRPFSSHRTCFGRLNARLAKRETRFRELPWPEIQCSSPRERLFTQGRLAINLDQ
jgi:hypothetical protein